MKKRDDWDWWNEFGEKLSDECEHNSGIVVFTLWRLSVVRCTWRCGGLCFEWLCRDGITRTFWVLK